MCITTKLSKNRVPQKPSEGPNLDTLAQLTTEGDESRSKFINRQKAKAITMAQVYRLIDVDSRLRKSYWRTYHCNRRILQRGYKMITQYCNGRWCTVCNRIRMAKMINAYSYPLTKLGDLYFVTLTTPNVKAHQLKDEIEGMYKSWRCINQNIRKTYKKGLQGMRKLECTYNPHADTYNPHFHFLVSGEDAAKLLISLWLKRYPTALIKGQDMRKANNNTLIELFKYTVKGVHKGKFYAEPLDVIYQALEGKRTYQPFGIKKYAEEDIDGIQSQEITFKGYQNTCWTWSNEIKDWVSNKGELLTEYIIEGNLSDWIDSLTDSESGELSEPEQEQTTIKLTNPQKDDIIWGYYSEMADEIINNTS